MIIRIVLALLGLYFGWQLFQWGVLNATWAGTPKECLLNGGACWAFIQEKFQFILFGRYPNDQLWQPALVQVLWLAMLIASAFWLLKQHYNRLWLWVVVLPFSLWLLDLDNLGGLPLTFLLSMLGIAGAFPLGVLLALGRTSKLPLVKTFCIGYIELVRGVPLISVLFMASFLFPLFLPQGIESTQFWRAQVAIILFAAAYVAEAIRGGLQSLHTGQFEAAEALGLSYRQRTQLVILPQALQRVIAPLVNIFIGIFKDTSLVMIIGLFDLLLATKTALADAPWRPFYVEAFIFTGLIYFVFCYGMSRYSQVLEKRYA